MPVKEVAEVTGFPEMLDGRLKTIHPRVAGGILAMRGKPDHMDALRRHDIPAIDMVVVNLYQFEKVAAQQDAPLDELIENIDIGGPTMIRAAAKNWQDVAVVVSPDDYPALIRGTARRRRFRRHTHWSLAKKAFATTAAYDRAISARLARVGEAEPRLFPPRSTSVRRGCWRCATVKIRISPPLYTRRLRGNRRRPAASRQGTVLQQSGRSRRRLAVDSANSTRPRRRHHQAHQSLRLRRRSRLWPKATAGPFEADPVSAFGGVLAFNRPLDEETAIEVAKTFVEAIAAPGYSPEALRTLAAKKNLRLLQVSGGASHDLVIKSISGGYLAQTPDLARLNRAEARVATARAPSEAEWAALEFGWKVVKHVKSNAIVFARPGQSVSVGAGQMSRVDSVKVGAMKAVLPLQGTVLASDAFFPFPDGIEEAAKHGITAVVQPGGSVRDDEVIAAANRLGLAMVFTGVRHFRH